VTLRFLGWAHSAYNDTYIGFISADPSDPWRTVELSVPVVDLVRCETPEERRRLLHTRTVVGSWQLSPLLLTG
jgi:hypothetical protein